MATRPPRLNVPHTYFHVTSRGTNRWNIFLDDADRSRFMFLLSATCRRYRVDVISYCLMDNHFHLILYCADPVLSSFMRDLKSRYATSFNRRHRGTGGVFEAPFVEVPILDDGQLMIEIRYVHRNPVDIDPSICLATYPWSSHGIYLGLRPEPSFMSTTVGRELFGPDYRMIVERPNESDKVRNAVQPIVTAPGDVTIVDGDEWSLAGIRSAVAHAAGCDLVDVRTRLHNGLIGLAALVAFDVAGFSASEIADPFGFSSAAAVRMAVRRARARLETDSEMRSVHRMATQRLNPAA